MTRQGLSGRVARLEATNAATCAACHGKPSRWEWRDTDPERGRSDKTANPASEQCTGCGRPVEVIRVSWQTERPGEGRL